MSGNPMVKLGLDIAIGSTSKIETEDSGKMADIVQRVKDLNSRLEDIRREQVFQRVGFYFFFSFAIYKKIWVNKSTGTRSRVS